MRDNQQSMLNPPWIEYPDYTPGCLGFRMGDGEDYIYTWWDFWRALSAQERKDFLQKHPPPSGWERYCPLVLP